MICVDVSKIYKETHVFTVWLVCFGLCPWLNYNRNTVNMHIERESKRQKQIGVIVEGRPQHRFHQFLK